MCAAVCKCNALAGCEWEEVVVNRRICITKKNETRINVNFVISVTIIYNIIIHFTNTKDYLRVLVTAHFVGAIDIEPLQHIYNYYLRQH